MDSLFFVLSKIVWGLIQPDSLLLYTLLLGLFFLYRQRLPAAKRLLSGGLLFFVLIGIFPVGTWLYAPLEQRFPTNPPLPTTVDGIILLGGFIDPTMSAYWQQSEVTEAADRLLAFGALAHRYPQAQLLMTGGSSAVINTENRETDAMPALLESLQIDKSRLILERESRNTVENALFSKALAQPKPSETWLLVTSANHMPRAAAVFCKQDWPILPWPVDHQWQPNDDSFEFLPARNMVVLNRALHEWVGLFSYYLTGKSVNPFSTDCSK